MPIYWIHIYIIISFYLFVIIRNIVIKEMTIGDVKLKTCNVFKWNNYCKIFQSGIDITNGPMSDPVYDKYGSVNNKWTSENL